MHKKIVEFDEITLPADGDLFLCVDVSDTTDDPTGSLKKIQKSNFLAAVAGLTPDYGEMYFYENTDGTAVPLTSTYYQIEADDPTTLYTAGPLNGFTFGSDALTCTNGGTFQVNAHALVRGAGGAIIDVAIFVDGVRQDNLVSRAFDSNGTNPRSSVTITGLLVLTATDVVDLRVRNETSTTEPVVEYLNVSLVQVA